MRKRIRSYDRIVGCGSVLALVVSLGLPCLTLSDDQTRYGVPRGEISALCDRLLAAVRENDKDKATSLIDVPRFLGEMERQSVLGRISPADRTSLRIALHMLIGGGLLQEGQAGAWNTCKVHRIDQKPQSNEGIVVVRMLTKEGTHSSLMRLYVVKEQNRWSLYDWEDIDRIFRTSTHLAMTLAWQQGQVRGNYLQAILSAARLTGEGNDSVAEQILSQLANVELENVLEPARWLLLAKIKIGQGKAVDALKAMDLVAKLDPDTPSLPGMRAAAYQKQGSNEKAVELAKEALVRLGTDAGIYAVLGNALLGQGKRADALDAFRNGLSCDPNSVDSFVGLARTLPDDKKGELVPFLAKMENVQAHFPTVAQALLGAEDGTALSVLIAHFQKQFPNDPAADYYRGEMLLLKKDYIAAAKAFGEAASSIRNEEQRERVNHRLLDSWFQAGMPLEGYKAAPNAGRALEYLGEQLLEQKDEANLTQLAKLHQAQSPADPRGFYYCGQAHMLAKRYAEAEHAFADGTTKASNGEMREMFRRERVNARYHKGEGLSAYSDIRPRQATFDQLAQLYLENKQADQLGVLVATHRKNLPDAPALDLWEAEASLLKKDYATAGKLFKAAADQTRDDDEKQAIWDHVLECSALAGNPVEGYCQSPNADHAFQFLAEKLQEKKDGKSLAQLVDAHRQKDPKDIRLLFYGGQALLLEGKPTEAEKLFTEGMKKVDNESTVELFRHGRIQALYKSGQGMRAYNEIAPPRQTFDILAHLYTDDKNANGLQNLTAAHFKMDPDDPALGLWAAEARWLRRDFEATVEVLKSEGNSILKDGANRDRFEDRLIRSLGRLKRFGQAMKMARETSSRDGDPWYELVVHALSGDVKKATELMEFCAVRGYSNKDFHDDPDIGPALRSPAFQELVKRYPAPKDGDK
jgi:tetratricopeptide (TPR) repeat protein